MGGNCFGNSKMSSRKGANLKEFKFNTLLTYERSLVARILVGVLESTNSYVGITDDVNYAF